MQEPKIFCDMVNDWIKYNTCKQFCRALGNREIENCKNCYKSILF